MYRIENGYNPELEEYKKNLEELFIKHRKDWVNMGAAFLRKANFPLQSDPVTKAKMSDTYKSKAEDAVQEIFTRYLMEPSKGKEALNNINPKSWVSNQVKWELKRQYRSVGTNAKIVDAAAPFRSVSLESLNELNGEIDTEQHITPGEGTYQLDQLLPDNPKALKELDILLQNLKPRSEEMLRMRFGLKKNDNKEYSVKEIAKHFNISQGRVNLIIRNSLRELNFKGKRDTLNTYSHLMDKVRE